MTEALDPRRTTPAASRPEPPTASELPPAQPVSAPEPERAAEPPTAEPEAEQPVSTHDAQDAELEQRFEEPEAATIAEVTRMAKGGPVSAGKDYLVGEDGPEIFSPTQDGTITPNRKGKTKKKGKAAKRRK
jgi:hypothetical protein